MGTDGANTMVGKEKGLFGRLRQVKSHLVSVWCIAHIIHSVAKESVSELPSEIQELPVLLYWFRKS